VLQLHDTATGEVAPLSLREPGRVSLYVCGPTVYDAPHLGHGRFSLVFDVLRRYLLFTGLDVTYVSNITDIEDKIIERAAAQGISTSELTATYEAVWWEAMDALGVLRPDETPHATAYVDRMVDLVRDLMARGVAYETGDGVYLSVQDVPGYGLLALQPLESLRAGARVEADEDKRSPLDFALWKKAKPGEPSWEAPWGPGRPGWHTECVVMSLDLLGDGFELHGGGLDLMFPHHENERAQAVASGREFARHWMHNGWVTVGGEKMSKSLGNFTSLSDLLARSDGRAYRLLVLRSHYRSPIEVTPDTIADAEAGLARLDELGRRFELVDPLVNGPVVDTGSAAGPEVNADAVARFRQRMDDDLDTPGALAIVFDLVRQANTSADAGDSSAARRAAHTVALLCAALGLPLRRRAEGEVDAASAGRVRRRDRARAAGHWAEADALRSELERAGWLVEDGPDGTRIRRR
jgi:cysteinyl-tRNA synthetase